MYRFVARDGRVVWVRGEAKLVRDEGGRPLFLQGVAFDITAIKRAEEELRLLNQTLEERVRERTAEAERRAEELARSNRELEGFGRVVAHDLREPLRSMNAFTRKLADHFQDQLEGKGGEFVERIVKGTERMHSLIKKLLDYARVGSDGKSFAPVDSAEVFAAARANLHAAIEEDGAEVTAGPLPRVWADATQLEQLLQNLIDNALKFRAAGRPPLIHVEARPQDAECLFTVTDNGIGIERQYLDRIFGLGMESRLNSVREYPGHGVGLATCARIVQRHGGRIWADSPGLDRGAVMAFTLPDEPPGQ